MKPSQEFTFSGSDSFTVVAYAWLPTVNKDSKQSSQSLKGVVQISHGMAEHALRYGRIANALNDAGYAVYANDHRGHGKTAAQADDIGFFAEENGWSLVVQDMHELNKIIATEHPSLPVFLLGHSMGSLLSQDYISQFGDGLVGTILSASISDAGFLRKVGLVVAKIERLRISKRGKSTLLNNMSFGDFNKPFQPNRTEFDWISRDSAEVDKYISDPLCGFMVSTQLWIDVLDGLGHIAQEKTRSYVPNTLPILLITGEDDPVTKKGKMVDELESAYKNAGINDVSVKKYQGGRHESLNETNRDEITTDLIVWLNTIVENS